MTNLITFLTTLWLSSAAAHIDAIVSLGRGVGGAIVGTVTKEVAAATRPVEEIGVGVLFKQCELVKKILKVDYQAFSDGKEPDLSKLTLNYYAEGVTGTFNLAKAPELIPKSFWFDPSLKLYIYMHGFTQDPSQKSFQMMSDAFSSQGKVNIIALDASSLIAWLYLRSSTYVRFIGQKLGELLASMVKAKLDPSTIHLIGHSLGSHIAGYAGKTFFNNTGLKIGRISGLDPAGPCFADLSPEESLNANDADFVDVIHTDAGVFGLKRNVGHVNFFPNGGSEQPKCLLPTCGHSRSWKYFAESVTNPKAFPAVSCGSWKEFRNGACNTNDTSYMGFGCTPGTVGTYYLQTRGESPFGLEDEGMKFKNNMGLIRNTLTALLHRINRGGECPWISQRDETEEEKLEYHDSDRDLLRKPGRYYESEDPT